MADGRFGCEADMAGPAAGSTRLLVTHRDIVIFNHLGAQVMGPSSLGA